MTLQMLDTSHWTWVQDSRTKRIAKSIAEGIGLIVAMGLVHVGIAYALSMRTAVLP